MQSLLSISLLYLARLLGPWKRSCRIDSGAGQWRRLHGTRGHVTPPLLQISGHGGTVSRRTANKKLTKLHWPPRKRLPSAPHFRSGPVLPPLSNSFRRHWCSILFFLCDFIFRICPKVFMCVNRWCLERRNLWLPKWSTSTTSVTPPTCGALALSPICCECHYK